MGDLKFVRTVGKNKELNLYESETPPREGHKYYFRAVTQLEFDELVANNRFTIQNSYQGIAEDVGYVSSNTYFGGNGKQSRHVIEFEVDDSINIKEEFAKNNVTAKAEGGVMSYGLGYKASKLVQKKGDTKGGEHFMKLMTTFLPNSDKNIIRWRLVKFIGKELPQTTKG